MSVLFVFGSITLIVFLLKCIYENIEKETPKSSPPPPTLEDILTTLLKLFQKNLHQFEIFPDRIIIYCFKNSPQDDIKDFNEIQIRFCDIGFKAIPNDECTPLQEKLNSNLGIVPKTDTE